MRKQMSLITRREIEKIAGVVPKTVYSWEKKGKIVPVVRKGLQHLYDREKVMKFINKRAARLKAERKKYWGE